MGVALYVSLEKKVDDIDVTVIDGKFMAKHQDRIDSICEAAGSRTLGSFISVDPKDFEDMLPDPAGKFQDEEEWFDAKDGLAVLDVLDSYFLLHPIEYDTRLKDDLINVREVLTECEKKGVRFHFAIDF